MYQYIHKVAYRNRKGVWEEKGHITAPTKSAARELLANTIPGLGSLCETHHIRFGTRMSVYEYDNGAISVERLV